MSDFFLNAMLYHFLNFRLMLRDYIKILTIISAVSEVRFYLQIINDKKVKLN